MSTVLSSAKSRWKGAMLAAASVAALAPAVSEASLTVNLTFANGATTMNATSATTPISIYVYATVTGAAPVSAGTGGQAATSGNFDGLSYLYYNITKSAPAVGTLSAPMLNSTLGFNGGTFNASNASAGVNNGSQVGALNAGTALPLGSTTAVTDVAKPRANQAVFDNFATPTTTTNNNVTTTTYVSRQNDGTNIITGASTKIPGSTANSASFLVETLTFTPGTITSGTTTTFAPSIPTSLFGTTYASANWFEDNKTFTPGAEPTNTVTSFNGSYNTGSSVTITEGATATFLQGDLNMDGIVNIADYTILAGHFGQSGTASNAAFMAVGDINGDGIINIADYTILASNFGKSSSSAIFADAATEFASVPGVPANAVPEPTVLGLVGMVSGLSLGRKRRVVKSA